MKLTATFAVLASVTATGLYADIERGEKAYNKCIGCHEIGEDSEHTVGPHLNGIFGRKAGSHEDFDWYSDWMIDEGTGGLVWNEDTLYEFIKNPNAVVPNTAMGFRGYEDPEDIKHVIEYLKLFQNGGEGVEGPAVVREVELSDEILAIEGDVAYGEYLSSDCTTCHQEDGQATMGVPAIVGWPTENFVYAMHAYKEKVRENPVMQMMAGNLGAEEIAAIAAYFKQLGEK